MNGQSLFSILQSLTHPVNLSIWMLVGAISISSFFSFWKLDYFSDMNCLKNPLSDMISCSSSTQLITSDIRVRYWPRIYSLNIKSIPIGEIPITKSFPICALNNLRSHCTKIIVARLLKLNVVYPYWWHSMTPEHWAQMF